MKISLLTHLNVNCWWLIITAFFVIDAAKAYDLLRSMGIKIMNDLITGTGVTDVDAMTAIRLQAAAAVGQVASSIQNSMDHRIAQQHRSCFLR